jgi:hypothetical protein
MADYSIAAVTRRAVYTGSAGTGPYAFTFALLATSDIAVYKNATKLTETSDYSVTLSSSTGQGSVTLAVAATSSDTITLVGARALARTTDFVTSGSLTASALNTDLDSLVIFAQQLSEENSRNLKAPVTEGISGTTDMTIPAKDDRLGKILQFNSSTGNPEVTTFTLSGVTATDTELNILDGATLSTTELNILDGVTSTTAELNILDGVTSNATELNLLDGITGIADEDDMSSNSATKLSTQQSIKAYVDSQVTSFDTLAELTDTNISSLASGHILIYDGSDSFDNKAVSGDITISSTGAVTIANNAVETAMINADAVTNAKIADDSIDSEHYVDGSIDTAHIGDLQVTTAKIAADAITGAKLADDAVNSEHYTDGSIDTAHIADLQVTTAKIAADAITSAKIADDAISEEHLDPTVISGLADTTIASGDHLMFFDATDSALKKVDAAELGVGSALTEVVGDTSPQLGGTLDANGNAIDMNGLADGIILDADGDTTISAPTDDQIDIEIAGADDFTFTANTFTALSGSDINIASGATITNNGTAIGFGITRPNVEPLIINGAMTVAQRGTVTGIVNPGAYGGADRLRADIRGGFGVQVAQSTDVPSGYGFTKSHKLDVTTADTSPDANGLLLLAYFLEGADVSLLKYGTSSAETVTIAFWVKSNKTGTFQVNLRIVEAYHIGQLVTISSANTWEKKVITFVGNTSNAMATDNTEGMRIQFFFDAGSDNEGGGVPSSWASITETKSYNGSLDLGDNTANEILITGLQMEVGSYTSSTLPEFQHESFSDSLQRCQRYYEKSYNATTDPGTATLVGVRHGSGVAGQTGTGEIAMGVNFLTPKRTTPTMVLYDRSGNSGKCSRADLGTAEHTNQTASAVHTGENSFAVSSGSGSTGATIHCHFEAKAEF